MRRVGVAISIAAATVTLAAPLAGAAKDDVVLVSLQSASDGGASGDSGSGSASISGDGRYVAFVSGADNLSDRDTDGSDDVYVRDVQADTTALVSRQSASDGGAGADAFSNDPEISDDGRYVVFRSTANNLVGGDANGDGDVFVRDTQTNMTALVSRQSASAGNAPGDEFSAGGSISGDGRYVAFSSAANNFVTGENEAVENIFLRDRQTNATTLVSRQTASDGGAGADAYSTSPAISADGRYVAFESEANNLALGENESVNNIFIHDTQAQTTTLVTRQSASDGGTGADDDSYKPSISSDGRYVAFESYANNFVVGEYEGGFNVFVRDTQAETTTLVSRQSASDGAVPGDDDSYGAAISGNGRYVAFESTANNFASGEREGGSNIFVRDTQAETTSLMTRQSASDGGAPADESSDNASISGDGRWVGFNTDAENLSALDTGGYTDVFIYDYLGESPPGDPPPSTTDTTAPGLGASTAKSRQKLGKALKVTVMSDEDAGVRATATATPKGKAKRAKKLKFKPAAAQAAAGTPLTLKLKPSKKTARKLKAAAKAKAKITLSATDSADNTATRTLKVKLR